MKNRYSKERGSDDVGHAAVQVDEKVYGYYPTDEKSDGALGMDDLTGSQGVMKVESRDEFDQYCSQDGITDFTLEVTESQAASIKNSMERKVSAPGTYRLQGDQCTSVACDAFNNAGVNLRRWSENVNIITSRPVSSLFLSPGEYKKILSESINKNIVVGQRTYGGK